MVSIFDHESYKAYLTELIRSLPNRGHGVRIKLAEFVGCQSTYISQVLKSNVHFNLEQAERVGRYFQLSDTEVEYLLLLVQEERAATRELKASLKKSRERLLEVRKTMKNRFQTPQPLSPEDQAKFYSAWHYAALHVLLTIPEFRSKEAIHERLGLPMPVVNEALDFLTRIGFVNAESGAYLPNQARTYLGNDSPLVSKHHMNWRLRTMQNLDYAAKDDLHYSSVVTISEADFQKIRETFVKTLEGVRTVIKESPEEKLCSLCLDFYEV